MDHNLRAFWNPFLVTNSLQLQRWSMILFGEKTTGCAIFTGEKHHQTPKHHKTVCQFQGSSGSYRNYFLGESWPQFGALGWCVGGPWPLRSPKQNNDIEIPPKIHMKNHEDAITKVRSSQSPLYQQLGPSRLQVVGSPAPGAVYRRCATHCGDFERGAGMLGGRKLLDGGLELVIGDLEGRRGFKWFK